MCDYLRWSSKQPQPKNLAVLMPHHMKVAVAARIFKSMSMSMGHCARMESFSLRNFFFFFYLFFPFFHFFSLLFYLG